MFKYISTYIFVKLALRRRLTINCFCISTENESLNVYVIFLSQIFLKQNSITLYTLILKSRGLNLFLRYSRIFKPKYILEWFYSECPSPRRLIISTTYVFMYIYVQCTYIFWSENHVEIRKYGPNICASLTFPCFTYSTMSFFFKNKHKNACSNCYEMHIQTVSSLSIFFKS